MAGLNITEFKSLIGSGNAQIQVPQLSGAISQDVAMGATSAAFDEETRFVMLVSDTDCRIKAGAAPTASGTDTFIPANVPVFFGVERDDLIAVIANA